MKSDVKARAAPGYPGYLGVPQLRKVDIWGAWHGNAVTPK